MGKKNKAKKAKPANGSKSQGKQQETTFPGHEREEKPFDFGGLPDRDLKKNLGCG